ncbi:MAG: hypothetical protein HY047_03880 [Acidobacteria bacterium]|nr:hypothetical protein [Acidobacteriota bacterium]
MRLTMRFVGNGVSILGMALMTASAVLFLIVFFAELFGLHTNPYSGQCHWPEKFHGDKILRVPEYVSQNGVTRPDGLAFRLQPKTSVRPKPPDSRRSSNGATS